MDNTVNVLGIRMVTQKRRQVLVIALYASYLLVLIPFWLAHAVKKELLALALPAFLIWAACFYGLSQVTRAYAYSSNGRVSPRTDERESQVRDQSFTRAYQILSALLCLTILYGMMAQDFHWWLPQAGEFQGVLFGAILLSATLPSAIVAWSEKDDPEEMRGDSFSAQNGLI